MVRPWVSCWVGCTQLFMSVLLSLKKPNQGKQRKKLRKMTLSLELHCSVEKEK